MWLTGQLKQDYCAQILCHAFCKKGKVFSLRGPNSLHSPEPQPRCRAGLASGQGLGSMSQLSTSGSFCLGVLAEPHTPSGPPCLALPLSPVSGIMIPWPCLCICVEFSRMGAGGGDLATGGMRPLPRASSQPPQDLRPPDPVPGLLPLCSRVQSLCRMGWDNFSGVF